MSKLTSFIGVRTDRLHDLFEVIETEWNGVKIECFIDDKGKGFMNNNQVISYLNIKSKSSLNTIVRKIRFDFPKFGQGGIFKIHDLQSIQNHLDKRNKEKNEGFLYIIRDKGSGLIKIGITSNLGVRLSQLNTMVPMGITKIFSLKTTHYKELERHLHKEFAEKRMNGEWFDFDEVDINSAIFLANEKGIKEIEKTG